MVETTGQEERQRAPADRGFLREPSRDEAAVVPAVGAPSSVWCLRSLHEQGIHTIAVGEDATSPAFASRYCSESIQVPGPDDDLLAYKDALVSIASRPEVRAILPLREPDVYVLSKYDDEFRDHVTPFWPSFETLERVHDRVELVEAAKTAGVSVPETRLLDEEDRWDRNLIVKARYAMITGHYVSGAETSGLIDAGPTRYLRPGSEPDIDRISTEMGHVPIVQEYVAGTEYTFRGLWDHGTPIATTGKRLVRGMKYPRGPSVTHEAVDDPRLEAAANALLEELDWHGLASVGFIKDDDTGEFKLLEINPRFWASLPMDIHAGVDYPYYYWLRAVGETDRINPSYEPGVMSHRLAGLAVHLHSVAREEYPLVERPSLAGTIWEIARDIYRHPRFDLLSVDDSGPFIRDVRNRVIKTGLPGGRTRTLLPGPVHETDE